MRTLLIAALFAVAANAAEPSFKPPANGEIPVAVVITEGANVIDFSGPWEVFQDTMPSHTGGMQAGFRLYTVGDAKKPVKLTGGLTVVPDYAFDDAPVPKIVVVGAQRGSAKMLEWLRRINRSADTDVMMSVCTGAFKFAAAGLLDGKHATTHHDYFDDFAGKYPKVTLDRGSRFVQSDPHVFTAGGLTSGIDLALHVVELYYGAEVAQQTARYMEYRGDAKTSTASAR